MTTRDRLTATLTDLEEYRDALEAWLAADIGASPVGRSDRLRELDITRERIDRTRAALAAEGTTR